MLTCREVAEAVASDELERASWRRRLAVRLHLLMCSRCRGYARQIHVIGEGARSLFAGTEEDEERVKSLREAILKLPGSED